MADAPEPRIVVLSSLFPSAAQPGAGLFIRERMFRVGRQLPLAVVSPQPWFPLQGLIRRLQPGFRPGAPRARDPAGHRRLVPALPVVPGMLQAARRLVDGAGRLAALRRLQRARPAAT